MGEPTDEEVAVEAAAGSAQEPPAAEPVRPLLRVVKGDPTDEELAALVAVVAARNAAAAQAASRTRRRPRSEWGHPARSHRTPRRVGPDQWRRSSWA